MSLLSTSSVLINISNLKQNLRVSILEILRENTNSTVEISTPSTASPEQGHDNYIGIG